MSKFNYGWLILAMLAAHEASAQTFTRLLSFTGTGGVAPGQSGRGSLTLSGSTLYGMTTVGGALGDGNVFSVGVDGSGYRNLVSFTGTSGVAPGTLPDGNVTLSGSTLYGMTSRGGAQGFGNIFRIGVDGSSYQNLLSFTGTSGVALGRNPIGSLTLSGSTLYGMTAQGGAQGCGNIFSIGVDGGGYQNLLSFTGTGGVAPGYQSRGSFTLSGSTLYGMTAQGGAQGFGNIFSVGLDGSGFQNLHTFAGSDGSSPMGDLTLGGSMLYGMTEDGGTNGDGSIFRIGVDGSGFQSLYSFDGGGGGTKGTTGLYPQGSLLLIGAALYGMTSSGGSPGPGNMFSIGLDGSGFQNLHTFVAADGQGPDGNPTLSGGTLFGMTTSNGPNHNGTVFALTGAIPTPEPSTLALAGCGAAAGLAYRWRRCAPMRRQAIQRESECGRT